MNYTQLLTQVLELYPFVEQVKLIDNDGVEICCHPFNKETTQFTYILWQTIQQAQKHLKVIGGKDVNSITLIFKQQVIYSEQWGNHSTLVFLLKREKPNLGLVKRLSQDVKEALRTFQTQSEKFAQMTK